MRIINLSTPRFVPVIQDVLTKGKNQLGDFSPFDNYYETFKQQFMRNKTYNLSNTNIVDLVKMVGDYDFNPKQLNPPVESLEDVSEEEIEKFVRSVCISWKKRDNGGKSQNELLEAGYFIDEEGLAFSETEEQLQDSVSEEQKERLNLQLLTLVRMAEEYKIPTVYTFLSTSPQNPDQMFIQEELQKIIKILSIHVPLDSKFEDLIKIIKPKYYSLVKRSRSFYSILEDSNIMIEEPNEVDKYKDVYLSYTDVYNTLAAEDRLLPSRENRLVFHSLSLLTRSYLDVYTTPDSPYVLYSINDKPVMIKTDAVWEEGLFFVLKTNHIQSVRTKRIYSMHTGEGEGGVKYDRPVCERPEDLFN